MKPIIERKIFRSQPDSNKVATAEYVLKKISNPGVVLLDVRSAEEYRGEKIRAKRGGHIPGAVNIEWKRSMNEDHTFKNPQELNEMFIKPGVTKDKEIKINCLITSQFDPYAIIFPIHVKESICLKNVNRNDINPLVSALWSVPARTIDIPSGLVEVGTLLEYIFI